MKSQKSRSRSCSCMKKLRQSHSQRHRQQRRSQRQQRRSQRQRQQRRNQKQQRRSQSQRQRQSQRQQRRSQKQQRQNGGFISNISPHQLNITEGFQPSLCKTQQVIDKREWDLPTEPSADNSCVKSSYLKAFTNTSNRNHKAKVNPGNSCLF